MEKLQARKVDWTIKEMSFTLKKDLCLQQQPHCNQKLLMTVIAEELNPTSGDTLSPEHEEREVRNYESEEQEDDGNSDVEHDGYEEDEDDDFLDGEPAVYNNDFTICDLDCDVVGDIRSGAAASGCGSGDVDIASSGVVPAKNLQRSEDSY